MQVNETPGIKSGINVTPLVDVVLVLLIIFMVMAPQLQSGPEVDLPATDRPQEDPEGARQILVTIERDGTLWVETDRVRPEDLARRIREVAGEDTDGKVLLRGDGALRFGTVKRAMLAVEDAGFRDVSLIAEKLGQGS